MPFQGTCFGGALGVEAQLDLRWPNRLEVGPLHQNPIQAASLDGAIGSRDLDAAKSDIEVLRTSSVSGRPSGSGNCGPQMIRVARRGAGADRAAYSGPSNGATAWRSAGSI